MREPVVSKHARGRTKPMTAKQRKARAARDRRLVQASKALTLDRNAVSAMFNEA